MPTDHKIRPPHRPVSIMRCQECALLKTHCICGQLETFQLSNTKINIIMHHREEHLASNTVRLAKLILPEINIHLRGIKDVKLNVESIISSDSDPVFLFPSEDALDIDFFLKERCSTKPINLIIPDGSWQQARKVVKRESFLANVPKVKIPLKHLQEYYLRRAPKPGFLSTFEAMTFALSELESPELRAKMMVFFRKFVECLLNERRPKKNQLIESGILTLPDSDLD